MVLYIVGDADSCRTDQKLGIVKELLHIICDLENSMKHDSTTGSRLCIRMKASGISVDESTELVKYGLMVGF